jgi:hypothetical protein
MRCSICGIQIDLVEDAIEQGWTPSFCDGKIQHDPACPACTDSLLQINEHGEWEVKEKYRGKLRYLDESEDEACQDHLAIGIAVLENEPGKLN